MAFPTTPILDTFAGADESPITTNWSGPIYPGLDQMRRLSGQLAAPATSFGGSWYDIATYGPDCEIYITIQTLGADGNSVFLYARTLNLNTTSLDGYSLHFETRSGADFFRLIQMTDGGDTIIDSDDTISWSAGDSLGMACIGSNIQGWRKPVAGSWTQVLDATDTVYPGAGFLAVAADADTFRLDDFGGGTIGGVTPGLGDNPPMGFSGRGAGW